MNLKKSQKIFLTVIAFLFFIYLITGFFILPKVAKTKLVEELSETTGSEVTLGGLSTNPLLLTASLEDFKIIKNGNETVAFEKLYVDFSISSVVKRSLNFSELTVDKPFVNIVISNEGRLNLLDLVPQNNDETEKENSGDEGIFPLLIKKIAFNDGNVLFQDLSNQTPYRSEIRSLSFILSNLSTIPDEKGLYELNATLNESALIEWKGSLNLNPVVSKGTLKFEKIGTVNIWDYLRDMVNFKVAEGIINFDGQYEIDLSTDQRTVNLKNSNLSLNNFSMVSPSENSDIVSIPSLDVSGIDFELAQKKLDISKITTADGKINGLIDQNGELNFTRLLKTENENKKRPVEESGTENEGPPINMNIKEIDISGYTINFKDNSLRNQAEFRFAPTDMNIKNFSLGKSEIPLTFSTVFNDSGKVNIDGQLVAPDFTSSISLKLQGIPVKLFQPYIGEFAGISLEDGMVSADGELMNLKQDGEMNVKLSGNLNIKGFRASEEGSGEKLLNFSGLQVRGARFDLVSRLLDVEKVVVNKLDTNIVIGPDGAVNLKNLVKSGENREGGKKKNGSPEEAKTEENGITAGISQVDINDSIVEFSDYSVEPNFKTTIDDLNVVLKGLSTKSAKTASIELSGKVDKYAPIEVKGEINPLGEKTRTDINLDIDGIELTSLNPYSGKHVGYNMDRGKLSLNLEYILNEKLLDGKNRIVFDQIELGSKTDSPEAKDLPLELAISLLKDSSGAVKLDFPVSGDPTDPSFSISGIVFKTFFNLIFKAVTSPFSILGSIVGIFGSGEDLSQVAFQPGSSTLSEKESKDLDKLSEALAKRPNLKLEIRGKAFDKVDRLALAEKQIIADVRDDDAKGTEKPLTEDEIEDILEIYEDDFGIDPLDSVAEEYENGEDIPKMERLRTAYDNSIEKLKKFETVKDNSMVELAGKRAEAIRDYVANNGGIEQARIFTLQPSLEISETAEDVKVTLSVGSL